MKKPILLISLILITALAFGQLKARVPCATFTVDWIKGTVNNVSPDVTQARIKELLPCFSSVEEEAAVTKCGGKLEYKDKDVRFFTKRDYVEIGPRFKGKQSFPLLGVKKNTLFKRLGNPQLKDPEWEAYQTAYGCLVVYFTKAGIINKVRFSTNGTGTLQLCE